jgi:hypothetical protein
MLRNRQGANLDQVFKRRVSHGTERHVVRSKLQATPNIMIVAWIRTNVACIRLIMTLNKLCCICAGSHSPVAPSMFPSSFSSLTPALQSSTHESHGAYCSLAPAGLSVLLSSCLGLCICWHNHNCGHVCVHRHTDIHKHPPSFAHTQTRARASTHTNRHFDMCAYKLEDTRTRTLTLRCVPGRTAH